jgi:flagellar biosynthesis GTPase FlhF
MEVNMNVMKVTVLLVLLTTAGIPIATWAKGDEAKRKARVEARAQKHESRKETVAAKHAGAKETVTAKHAEAKEAAAAKHAEAKEAAAAKHAEAKEAAAAKRGESVDNRQERQAKRIEHGISKGYLTAEETATLQSQQTAIANLEESYKSDGKMTGQEIKSLQTQLNTASHCIWGEKHDTEGNQMAVYRLGKNVFAKDSFTTKMSDPNLSTAEAKALCKDFRRITELKRQLSSTITDAERTKLQAEYNELLNTYFEVR